MTIRNIALGATLAAGLAAPLAADALTIGVTTTEIGGGVWQYSYLLSGGTFNQNEGFTIYFDYSLYGTLSNPTAGTDWDALVVQRDLGAPADGFFDALALVNSASLADPFKVDFQWLGSGMPPGNQAFETYLCNNPPTCDGIAVTGAGTTGPSGAAPAPAPLALLAAGLIGLGMRRTRGRSSPTSAVRDRSGLAGGRP